MKRCATCYFWEKTTNKYGDCAILTNVAIREVKLRFAYEKGEVKILTPRYGICNEHKSIHDVGNS